jgi:hypothetical protein
MSKSIKNPLESGSKEKQEEAIPQKSVSGGKTTQQMMNKHIHDEKDVITDEDFKNLKLDLELPGDEAHQPLEIPNDPDRPKDEDKDPKVMTPWDLIN